MKPMHVLAALAAASTLAIQPAATQTPPAAPAKPSLAPFAWLDGQWRGPATIQSPKGQLVLTQTERSGTMLNGAVRVIEGKAYGADGRVAFNAFAVLYAKPDGTYEMHSWTGERSGIFAVVPVEGGFDWSIPAGPMTIHYEARFKDGKWTETGYRVMPGKPPIEFMRMELVRTGPSDWPAAGSPAAN